MMATDVSARNGTNKVISIKAAPSVSVRIACSDRQEIRRVMPL